MCVPVINKFFRCKFSFNCKLFVYIFIFCMCVVCDCVNQCACVFGRVECYVDFFDVQQQTVDEYINGCLR